MTEIKYQIRKTVRTIKDKIKNDQQVRDGIGMVVSALMAIIMRAIPRK